MITTDAKLLLYIRTAAAYRGGGCLSARPSHESDFCLLEYHLRSELTESLRRHPGSSRYREGGDEREERGIGFLGVSSLYAPEETMTGAWIQSLVSRKSSGTQQRRRSKLNRQALSAANAVKGCPAPFQQAAVQLPLRRTSSGRESKEVRRVRSPKVNELSTSCLQAPILRLAARSIRYGGVRRAVATQPLSVFRAGTSGNDE